MKLISLLYFLTPWLGSAQLHKPNGVVTVSEGAHALLPCALGSGQGIDLFDWRKDSGEEEKQEVFFYDKGSHYSNGLQGQSEQFKDRVVFFQHELTTGNASIMIKNTRLKDNGLYTCVLFEPHRQEVKIRLNVGAATVPYVKQIHVERTRWLLQCKAEGIPKPELEWRDSAGEALSDTAEDQYAIALKDASERFHVELQLNVTRSDTYVCVATQRDIYHQINNTLKVYIQEKMSEPNHSSGWTVAAVFGSLLGLVVAVVIGALCYVRQRKSSD